MGIFIGIVAGLSNIVPYLPVVVGLAPALILAYLSFGDVSHIALVAALFAGAQAIEGLYITPKVLEKAVGLHPVAVMASLLIGGAFFGFIGVVLAVPVAAALKVILVELDSDYLKSDFYLGDTKNRDKSGQ
jgi:predicted PurR-regulated permease PerM